MRARTLRLTSRIVPALLLWAWVAVCPVTAQQELPVAAEPPAHESSTRLRLDAIREDLVELEFERALAAIEALLGQPGLSADDRAEALVLRSQTHVAFGDTKAAEEDWRLILRMRPGYVPETSLTPRKAMERFKKLHASLIGRLMLDVQPPDAQVEIDGRAFESIGEEGLPLMAGQHVLWAEKKGFDAAEYAFTVEADKNKTVRLQLVPNARSVIVMTEPDGVEILLDGVLVGTTERPTGAGGFAMGSAELVLEHLPPGEHVFELSKLCFRTVRRTERVTVDLLDHRPKRLREIRMVPARTNLVFEGGPPGASVLVDGETAGRLPLERLEVCPGTHRIQVRLGERIVWDSTEEFEESDERRVAVVPRPNLVLFGAEEWPPDMSGFAGRFNVTTRSRLPVGELSDPALWAGADLPVDTDIVLAVVAATREGAPDRWYLYSPILQAALRLDGAPRNAAASDWGRPVWGFSTADSEFGGPARVVTVDSGGPAAGVGLAVGARVVAAGGRAVSSAAELGLALRGAGSEGSLELTWQGSDGQEKTARLVGARSPWLREAPTDTEEATLRAAWAAVDAVSDPVEGSWALANLAMLFSAAGNHEIAARTWHRVEWPQRRGIGPGTAAYYLGRELELLGREKEAIEAYRSAAAGDGTIIDDDGPAVGPAARDRLADLGADTRGLRSTSTR